MTDFSLNKSFKSRYSSAVAESDLGEPTDLGPPEQGPTSRSKCKAICSLYLHQVFTPFHAAAGIYHNQTRSYSTLWSKAIACLLLVVVLFEFYKFGSNLGLIYQSNTSTIEV